MQFEVVTEGLQFPEGPVSMPDGSVLVVEIERRTVSRVWPDGRVDVVGEMGGGPNGLAIGPDGHVYACNNGGMIFHHENGVTHAGMVRPPDYVGGSIQRLDIKTGKVTILYTHCDGRPLNGPNDIVFDRTGGIWFTDIGRSYDGFRDEGVVFYARNDGSSIVRITNRIATPNGIGLSPDERTLYVADSRGGRLWACDILEPGVIRPPTDPWTPGRVVATLPGFQILDSLAVEAGGKVCVGTIVNGGITIFDPSGTTEFVGTGDQLTTNIAFGGHDMRDAWITASGSGKLLKCRWPRPGLQLNFAAYSGDA